MKFSRLLQRTGSASLTLLTAISAIAGIITGGFFIWLGFQFDGVFTVGLCGLGLILILYSLSLFA